MCKKAKLGPVLELPCPSNPLICLERSGKNYLKNSRYPPNGNGWRLADHLRGYVPMAHWTIHGV